MFVYAIHLSHGRSPMLVLAGTIADALGNRGQWVPAVGDTLTITNVGQLEEDKEPSLPTGLEEFGE